MKTTTMTFEQFFKMERGDITLKEIKQANKIPNPIKKEIYIIAAGIAALGTLAAITTIANTPCITAFDLNNIETSIPAFGLENIISTIK